MVMNVHAMQEVEVRTLATASGFVPNIQPVPKRGLGIVLPGAEDQDF